MTNRSYKFIDRNAEAVQLKPDTAPVKIERSVKDIENGLIDDTLSLIDLLDGAETKSDRLLHGEREFFGPFDAAMFLDKSGRPVRQLTHDLWKTVTNKPEPKSLFLNIDKRPWLKLMGYEDTEETNLEDINPIEITLDKIDPDYLHRELSALRALYLTPADFEKVDENDLGSVWNMPTRLDGKTIAIIDEV